MAKYSQKLVDKIVALIEEDNYTITDICKVLGINRKTFYAWKSGKADFAMAIAIAMENREERLKMAARQAIRKKLGGYKMVETKTVYAVDKNADDPSELTVKEYVVKDKFCVPETSAIALAIADRDMRKSGAKRMIGEKSGVPLNIVVSSDQAKKDIELLKKNLEDSNFRNGARAEGW